MKKRFEKVITLLMLGVLILSIAGCGSTPKEEEDNTSKSDKTQAAATGDETTEEPVTLKITWWGGQARHDYTQTLLDMYTESHPNITFEAVPSGWDGYFDKLSTQAASGSMPDIFQMDYLYISTYSNNGSLADMQSFIDDGTIDVSNIDQAVLDTGLIDGKRTGMVLSSALLSLGYNPEVFAEAGIEEPKIDWTWDDFIADATKITEATGKYGASMNPIADTNIFNYWVRQHGYSLFAEDHKSLGYSDDQVCADFFAMWKDLMDQGVVPNPDQWAQIETLGQEAGPVVTGDAGMLFEWSNYATRMSGINDQLKMANGPLSSDSEDLGLWMKPGMFFSVAETSEVKKEAAEFIDWFINSEEANDVIMAERGAPVSSAVRDYMINSGNLNTQQADMFQFITDVEKYCGKTPSPDPVGMSELNEVFKEAANQVFYDQISPEDAAAKFRKEADSILSRYN